MKITTLLTDDAVLAEIGALDAMPGLEGLIPEPAPRPMDLLKRRGKFRQRGSLPKCRPR
jgi:hypothetical protein